MLKKKNCLGVVQALTVEELVTVIKNMIYLPKNGKMPDYNIYQEVDGWIYGKENLFVFSALVTKSELSEKAVKNIKYRMGEAMDFSKEDLINSIIPKLFIYLSANWDKYKRYVEENKISLDILCYSFGWS